MNSALGEMIGEIESQPPAVGPGAEEQLSARIGAILDEHIDVLRVRMEHAVREVATSLPAEQVATLYREHERWQSAAGWRLINAADPCGT